MTLIFVVQHKTLSADDKKLDAALKKMAVQQLTGIEEVNMFKDDGTVIHYANPKGLFLCINISADF